MRKSDRVAARHTLLQSALRALKQARDSVNTHRISALGREFELVKGHELPPLSLDVWRVLIGGIERALQGDPDPFGLKIAGKPPKFSRQELISAVATVLKAEARGVPRMEAVAIAAEETGIGVPALREALADDDTLGIAEAQIAFEKRKTEPPPKGDCC